MTRGAFYWECLRRAWSGPLGVAEKTSFGASIAGGAVSLAFPQVAEMTNHLIWILPLVVGIVTFAVTWTLAPYTMYRDLERSAVLNNADIATQITAAVESRYAQSRTEIEGKLRATKEDEQDARRLETVRAELLEQVTTASKIVNRAQMAGWIQATLHMLREMCAVTINGFRWSMPQNRDGGPLDPADQEHLQIAVASLRVVASNLSLGQLNPIPR